ncbi:MAG TPA: vWA domain-containing protein [Saprospiraceae bacterium]|nr:vWA domain-containing protein [Saprospiraceae bacterium]
MEHYVRLLKISLVLILIAGCDKEVLKEVTEERLSYNADLASSTSSSGGAGGQNDPGMITAGEWNDLEEWDFWSGLLKKEEYAAYLRKWNLLPDQRYAVEIFGSHGNPVINACVLLKDAYGEIIWSALTDNSGSAELWASLSNRDHIPVTLETCNGFDLFVVRNPITFDKGVNRIQLGSSFLSSTLADIAFVVDATGSMGDELEYIKVELMDVISEASQLSNIDPRVGALVYRDEGDEYVVRMSALDKDLSFAEEFMQKQSADGGGDTPEAVHTALQIAIQELDWNPAARARLLFLVLDAPPHDSQDVVETVSSLTKLAAQKGIKIIPVSASGIAKETEFLLRAMDIFTNGTYVFITDHSGIGNPHIEPSVGEYEVEFLNELLIRLIAKYCK